MLDTVLLSSLCRRAKIAFVQAPVARVCGRMSLYCVPGLRAQEAVRVIQSGKATSLSGVHILQRCAPHGTLAIVDLPHTQDVG